MVVASQIKNSLCAWLLVMVVVLGLAENRAWGFFEQPQPAPGQIALATPEAIGETYDSSRYHASDSVVAQFAEGAGPLPALPKTNNSRGDVVGRVQVTTLEGVLSPPEVVWAGAYEAYGKRVAEFGETDLRQMANTKEEDPTGLLNEGFRYRDLETGIFITRDPAGFVDGPNVYTYVRQNPWTKFDPYGLWDGSDGYYLGTVVHRTNETRELAGSGDPEAYSKALRHAQSYASEYFQRQRFLTSEERSAIEALAGLPSKIEGMSVSQVNENLDSGSALSHSMSNANSSTQSILENGEMVASVLPGYDVGSAFTQGNYGEAGVALVSEFNPLKKVQKVGGVASGVVQKAGKRNLAPDKVGRKGAFNEAKRDAGIPRTQQPDGPVRKVPMTERGGKATLGEDGKQIMTREYDFTRSDGSKVVIQDHSAGHTKGGHGSHFNVRPAENTRTGKVKGTKPHYDFEK